MKAMVLRSGVDGRIPIAFGVSRGERAGVLRIGEVVAYWPSPASGLFAFGGRASGVRSLTSCRHKP